MFTNKRKPKMRPIQLPCAVQGRKAQRSFTGQGADEDIVVASARAYVSALNKMIPFLSISDRKLQREHSAAQALDSYDDGLAVPA